MGRIQLTPVVKWVVLKRSLVTSALLEHLWHSKQTMEGYPKMFLGSHLGEETDFVSQAGLIPSPVLQTILQIVPPYVYISAEK